MTPFLYELRIGAWLGLVAFGLLLRELLWPSDPAPVRLEDVPVLLRGVRIGLGLAAVVFVVGCIADRVVVFLLARVSA